VRNARAPGILFVGAASLARMSEEKAIRSLDLGANEGGQQDWCDRNRKAGKLTPLVGPG
jgi:hypothetical protein